MKEEAMHKKAEQLTVELMRLSRISTPSILTRAIRRFTEELDRPGERPLATPEETEASIFEAINQANEACKPKSMFTHGLEKIIRTGSDKDRRTVTVKSVSRSVEVGDTLPVI